MTDFFGAILGAIGDNGDDSWANEVSDSEIEAEYDDGDDSFFDDGSIPG